LIDFCDFLINEWKPVGCKGYFDSAATNTPGRKVFCSERYPAFACRDKKPDYNFILSGRGCGEDCETERMIAEHCSAEGGCEWEHFEEFCREQGQ